MYTFFPHYVREGATLPPGELLSSVFLIAIRGSKILGIVNDRGWEIPGGHIEPNETVREALIREVQEEAGATFANEKLFAIVGSDATDHYKDKVMLMYVTEDFELGEFTPSEDAFERELVEIEEFLKRHRGGEQNSFIKEIIEKAQEFLRTER